jgi:hypothetical protein
MLSNFYLVNAKRCENKFELREETNSREMGVVEERKEDTRTYIFWFLHEDFKLG